MIFDLIRNGFSINVVINLLARVFIVFCTLPIHEFAHAFVADKLGDSTPRNNGRLTINPMAHINLIGAAMIFLVGFGYANPVPVNARNFKNPKGGMAATAFAGPAANIIMAFVFLVISNCCAKFMNGISGSLPYVAELFFYYAASINVGLAIFNLIPIPPLDGSRIITLILPQKYYFKIMKYERYIIFAIFFAIMFGLLDRPLSFLTGAVLQGLNVLASLPF